MKVKFIEKAQNKSGSFYGLALKPDGTFAVYALKNSYAGHVKGGIISRWCLCIKDLDEATAREYFKKKLNGKVKL